MPAHGQAFNPHAAGNLSRGMAAEQRVAEHLRQGGYAVERYGHGADLKATKGGRTWFIEVKTGEGRLSRRQDLERLRRGDRYVVIREAPDGRLYVDAGA